MTNERSRVRYEVIPREENTFDVSVIRDTSRTTQYGDEYETHTKTITTYSVNAALNILREDLSFGH